jgi:2-oxoglutarate ferredoxin oxidoreductase subunit beta
MRTNTTKNGRDVEQHGFPLRMAELLGGIEGAAFVARTAVHEPAEIQRATSYLRKAFDAQRRGLGFSYVEILTMCPSGWHMDPVEALDFIKTGLSRYHPLGVVRDATANPA